MGLCILVQATFASALRHGREWSKQGSIREETHPVCRSQPDCPVAACPAGQSEADLMAFLSVRDTPGRRHLFDNIARALEILQSFGKLFSNDLLDLHTTVMYLCCYSLAQYEHTLFPAIDAVSWQPVNVTFDRLVCNYNPPANSTLPITTSSIILLLSPSSHASMNHLVDRFQTSMAAHNISVIPRATMEVFHVTVAVVTEDFPILKAMAAVNKAITDWTQGHAIVVDNFESILPYPHVFKATPRPRPAALYVEDPP